MNEKQVTILSFAVLAVLVLLFGGAVYYLHFVKLDEKKQELDTVTTQVTKATAKANNVPKLEKDLESAQKEEKEKIKKVPNLDRTEYDTFANLLDGLRKKAGVAVARGAWVNAQKSQQAAPGGKAAKSTPASMHKVQYDLTVGGTFYQLLKFINLLEQQGRFVNVESFSITAKQGSGEKDKLASLVREMKLTLYSFTYKIQEPLAQNKPEEHPIGKTTPIPD